MKSIFILFVILSQCCLLFGQGHLETKNPVLDLKNVKADTAPRTVSYQIKNTGDQPVIITRVTPMASQFKADWDRTPVAPGKSAEIRLTFTSANLPQEKFNYKIMVYSNASNKRLELGISGQVVDNPKMPDLLYKQNIDGLKFKSSHVGFNNIYTWQTVCDTVYFINSRPEAVTLGVQYKPSHIEATFVPAKVESGQKGAIVIKFDAAKKNDYGYSYESLVFSINNARNYANRLTVTATLMEDFSQLSKKELANAPVASFDKKEHNFGEIKKGEKTNCDFTLTNTGKSPLYIRKTKASCGCTAVTLGENTLAPGKQTVIRATFDSSGKSGRQYKTVTIITNDPQHPETVLNINGSVKE